WTIEELKAGVKKLVEGRFGYDLSFSLDEIRPGYRFDVGCEGSVPQAIRAFLESTDFEDAVRNAVSIGGDSDTLACIAGGIAQAFYQKIPQWIIDQALLRLPQEFVDIIGAFEDKYGKIR
ncbi:MAG TPA: ADP-ribosylglycohydrolase family protein, partial [Anaerohalosphaeraceae bacterium]|nr:ADP-ribosylglycohydrolase family protein [Anaerohalosphaeraceae bacterium]